MLRYGVCLDFTVLSHSVHLNFLCVLDKFRNHYGVLLRYVGGKLQELVKLVAVGADVHGSAGKHVAGAHEYRESHFIDEAVDIFKTGKFAPAGLVYAQTVEHGREFVAVLGVVNALGRCAENVDVLLVEAHGEIVGNLAAHGEYHAVGHLEVENIHYALECELVEVQAVAHVIVGRYGLGIIVYHH